MTQYSNPVFQYLFHVLSCHFYVLELPLNGRGLAGLGQDKAGFSFSSQNSAVK